MFKNSNASVNNNFMTLSNCSGKKNIDLFLFLTKANPIPRWQKVAKLKFYQKQSKHQIWSIKENNLVKF